MNNVVNPFKNQKIAAIDDKSINSADVESQRAIAEVQASMVLAKKFPRDQIAVCEKIILSCQRPTLASQAMYRYVRGGTEIVGPSIRLAEALAQQWGNIKYGWKTINQTVEYSEIETFAWDIETNTHVSRRITVKHWRNTKKGGYQLTDERDIYEICANAASRRMRACILEVIPSDVVEMATNQCNQTLLSSEKVDEQTINRLFEAFKEFNVSKAMIEKRIQRKITAITPQNMVSLRQIYNAIKSGFGATEEYFEVDIIEALPDSKKTKEDKKEKYDQISTEAKVEEQETATQDDAFNLI